MQHPATIIPQDPIFKGDNWDGLPAVTILINDLTPAAAIASAELIFFNAEKGPDTPELMLTSPTKITITSAAAWEIEVPPQILDLPVGEWTFRLRITDSAGIKKTFGTGTLLIL